MVFWGPLIIGHTPPLLLCLVSLAQRNSMDYSTKQHSIRGAEHNMRSLDLKDSLHVHVHVLSTACFTRSNKQH